MCIRIKLSTLCLTLFAAATLGTDPSTSGSRAAPAAAAPPAQAASTPLVSTTQLVSDNLVDTEPATITIKRSGFGTPYTLTAYMKFTNPGPRIHFAGTSDFASFDRGTLKIDQAYRDMASPTPTPTLYDRSGDPMCGANAHDDGVNRRTIYCIGTMWRGNWGGSTYGGGGIGVWRFSELEEAGNFRNVIPVELPLLSPPPDPATRFLDKPSITVSTHPATRGHVYAAAVYVPKDGSATSILFFRSTDGLNFTPVQLNAGTFTGEMFHSPIVVAEYQRNYVYLLWLSWATNEIYISRSTDGGLNWGPRKALTAGTTSQPLIGPDNSDHNPGHDLCLPGAAECFGARSMIMARHNWASHSIGVVWHRRKSGGGQAGETRQPTEVKFAFYDTGEQTWAWWAGVKTVSAQAGAQWNPALDLDENGRYLVTYYDTRDDPTGATYRLYGSRLDTAGNRIEPDRRLSNTAGRAALPGGAGTLGEYHDVSYFNYTWHVAWVSAPGGKSDISLTRVQTLPNVAAAWNGATATASSTFGSAYPASAVINGDRRGMSWGAGGAWADGTADTFPDWVQVDFRGPATIDAINVFTLQDNQTNPSEPTETMTFADYGITDFELQHWNGSGWSPIPGASVVGSNKVSQWFVFPEITTSRIRVVVHNALLHFSRITEVEAYGAPVSAPLNVALASNGTTALATSTLDAGRAPLAAINGDRRGLHWGSDPSTGSGWHDATNDAFPDTFGVAFNGPKTVDAINIFSVQDNFQSPSEPTESMTFTLYGLQDFDVEHWTGSAWVAVPGGQIVGNNKVWVTLAFPPVTTTNLRVMVKKAGHYYSRVVELEAWSGGTP